jgi:hypothetical protein
MRRLLVFSLAFAGLSLPAQATEWLICADAGKQASFSVLSGSLGIGTATDFDITVGKKSWSTKEGQGTPISKLQAFEADNMIFATVATEGLGEVVAELRLFRSMEGDSEVYGGVLKVTGEGTWAVSCH